MDIAVAFLVGVMVTMSLGLGWVKRVLTDANKRLKQANATLEKAEKLFATKETE